MIELLKHRFVPVAIDQAYQRRQQDAEGKFYQKIVKQSPREIGPRTTQGLYTASADGSFLGFTNNRGPKRTLRLLESALEKYKPTTVAPIDPGTPDARYNPEPPPGGFVVRVTSKVLGGYEESDNLWQRILRDSLGRDNLWVRADENKSLLAGRFPESLLVRIARFHLVDNTRGEPPMWKKEEVSKMEFDFEQGKLRATIQLATASGARAYKAELLGFVKIEDGRVTRFDMVSKGKFRGHGRYTPNPPAGWFPFAVAFTLANGNDVADRIPPQGSRGWVEGYIK